MALTLDPITLAVVQGVLESTQREMTSTIEKTSRSSVFNVARDYSNALFNGRGEMILQGQDIPIHLGSLMPALRAVADYFKDDTHDGDLFYHNDPAWSGSHIADCCMYKPVFYKGDLVFWAVSKGHVTDIGGPVPAGYNPDAKEILCGRIAYSAAQDLGSWQRAPRRRQFYSDECSLPPLSSRRHAGHAGVVRDRRAEPRRAAREVRQRHRYRLYR